MEKEGGGYYEVVGGRRCLRRRRTTTVQIRKLLFCFLFAPQKHKKKQKKSGVWMSKVKRVGTVAKNWFEADLCQIASRAFHILLKKERRRPLLWSSLDCCLGLLFQKNCLEAAATVEG